MLFFVELNRQKEVALSAITITDFSLNKHREKFKIDYSIFNYKNIILTL